MSVRSILSSRKKMPGPRNLVVPTEGMDFRNSVPDFKMLEAIITFAT